MGSGQCQWTALGQYTPKQGLSVHTALLPHLEQNAIYNAINFMWGMEDGSTTTLPYPIQSTASNAQINIFICPSDLYAGDYFANANCYFGSLGTTTYYVSSANATPPATTIYANSPSTGLFAYQQSYNIARVTDGTSNTIAFAESSVGNPNSALGQVNIGLTGVASMAAAQLGDANMNGPAVISALATCDSTWQSKGGTVDNQRGKNWIHGSMAFTLFNTVALPNSAKWTYCSDNSGSTATFSEADSYHSGGINVLMADGSVRFIKSTVSRATWWALGTKAGSEVLSADSY